MTHPYHHPAGVDEVLEDLLIDITRHVQELAGLVQLVRDLPDTHRPASLGFIPPSLREQMGRQWVQERHDQRQAEIAGLPAGRGASEAPGNLTSWSLEVDIEFTIRHLIKFALRNDPDADDGRGRREADRTEDVIFRLGGISRNLTKRRVAAAIYRDLDHLVTQARHTVYGETRLELGADCPHCGRRSLIVYVDTGVIQCEPPDRDDSRCECDPTDNTSQRAGGSRLCPCHSDPKHRHHWIRDRPKGHWQSWPALHDAIRHHTHKETPHG